MKMYFIWTILKHTREGYERRFNATHSTSREHPQRSLIPFRDLSVTFITKLCHLYRIVHTTCPSPGSCTDLTIQLLDSFSTFLSGKFLNACYVCRTDDSTTRTGCSTRYLKHGNVQQHLSSNFYLI